MANGHITIFNSTFGQNFSLFNANNCLERNKAAWFLATLNATLMTFLSFTSIIRKGYRSLARQNSIKKEDYHCYYLLFYIKHRHNAFYAIFIIISI